MKDVTLTDLDALRFCLQTNWLKEIISPREISDISTSLDKLIQLVNDLPSSDHNELSNSLKVVTDILVMKYDSCQKHLHPDQQLFEDGSDVKIHGIRKLLGSLCLIFINKVMYLVMNRRLKRLWAIQKELKELFPIGDQIVEKIEHSLFELLDCLASFGNLVDSPDNADMLRYLKLAQGYWVEFLDKREEFARTFGFSFDYVYDGDVLG